MASGDSFTFTCNRCDHVRGLSICFIGAQDAKRRSIGGGVSFAGTRRFVFSCKCQVSSGVDLEMRPCIRLLCSIPIITNDSSSVLGQSIFCIRSTFIGANGKHGVKVSVALRHCLDGKLCCVVAKSFFSSHCQNKSNG